MQADFRAADGHGINGTALTKALKEPGVGDEPPLSYCRTTATAAAIQQAVHSTAARMRGVISNPKQGRTLRDDHGSWVGAADFTLTSSQRRRDSGARQ